LVVIIFLHTFTANKEYNMVVDDDNFDSLFADEEPEQEVHDSGERWKILIVDDEQDIHSVIKLSLDNFIFENRQIQFFDAYSGIEAREILSTNNDIALVLLDVVMETDHAGLNFVKFIRDELKNHFIRIVLWTGQPGQAPKKEVVMTYEINDYKTKTDLTDDNIFTAVLSSIRSYNSMMIIEGFRQSLEEKVKERTKTIEEQKNKITDSITYARKIQDSILPSDKMIKSHFPESFVLYKPKDIVSGDFYWVACPPLDIEGKPNDKIFIAAADCTGHGVPGAFMSMIGKTILSEIVTGKKIFNPGEILQELNKSIIESLNQDNDKDNIQSDGMDITVCQVDYKNKVVQIGCANHIVLIVSGDTIEMIEGDIYSIGGLFTILQKPTFSNNIIPIDREMSIYIFSDGYQDQFGGEKNQKFMLHKFKDLIFSIRNLPMEEQKNILLEEHLKWRGNFRQIDDILVIGIKIHN